MAGDNTIGTGAVVLTASADQLLSGLDKARGATEKWAANTTKKATKAAGPGAEKGGLLGKLLFGAGGVAAGLLMGAGAFKAANMLASVGERAQNYGNISNDRYMKIDRAQKAINRIGAVWDDFLFKVAESLGPVLEKVASVLEVVGFVGGEAFGEIVNLIGDVVTSISKWIDSTFGLATATTSSADAAFAVLRLLGKGIAYLWDAGKTGAGVLALMAATVADSFGSMLGVIAKVGKGLADLANALPENLRPDGLKEAANALEGWGGKVDGIAAGLQKWGKGALAGFGDSAVAVDAWFDRVEARFKGTERITKGLGVALAGAFSQGSTEAYSVVAKWQAGNILSGQTPADNPVKIAKEQLKEAKEHKKATWKIVASLDRGTLVKVIK